MPFLNDSESKTRTADNIGEALDYLQPSGSVSVDFNNLPKDVSIMMTKMSVVYSTDDILKHSYLIIKV